MSKRDRVVCREMEPFMARLRDESTMLLWTDPPFGTGSVQSHESTWVGTARLGYLDVGPENTLSLIEALAKQAERVLHPEGTFALLLDYRAIHEAVVLVRDTTSLRFMGEVIYHFELGGVSRKWWTNKHNTIAIFAKSNPKFYLDRVPVVPRKAPRGDYTSETRRVNSVWTKTMGPLDGERTGYPNQKPLEVVRPFVGVHTDKGDLCVDPFAGSGTLGVAAKQLGRRYYIGDSNPEAVALAKERLSREV